ncbi:DUF6944 family repetitive protein [Shouchella shacheensis]|uniref:DUF6944 family repetitive protein n=1 Tax=Shouchella shacheensis TaxID=1649580 RepID=UPI0007404B5A|nr:hypothetical protein [Shouchella shacheensis]
MNQEKTVFGSWALAVGVITVAIAQTERIGFSDEKRSRWTLYGNALAAGANGIIGGTPRYV